MRVIAGLAKGHKLETKEGLDIRPTADKTKGAIFSMIGDNIYKALFLDLFSGSGSIGIEALSRRASFCAFVESSPENIAYINKNLNHVSKAIENGNYMVINKDFEDAIFLFKEKNTKFDIIFLDPPYNKNLVNQAIDSIYRHNILSDFGMIIAEQGAHENPPNSDFYEIYKAKKYGTSSIYFLKKRV